MPPESCVVVIEPERELLDAICFHFQVSGHECIGVTSPDGILRRLSERQVDLIVMDFSAAGRPTRDVPGRFAKVLSDRTRLLLMATRRDDPQVLTALEWYADDFVTKPINVPELLARGRALIRRTRLTPHRYSAVVTHGRLTVDATRRRVHVDGTEVRMTEQEFRFLYALMSHPGVVFTRQDVLEIIWGGDAHVTARCVDALVKRVRRRVKTVAPGEVPLHTVRGVGYKFEGQRPASTAPATNVMVNGRRQRRSIV